jgi:serine/threonine-protein kinase RsbW
MSSSGAFVPAHAMTYVRRIVSRGSELRPLSRWAVETARELGCPAERCHDIDLCLTEAVSNVIRHGYLDQGAHEIRVELAREAEAVVLRIEDDARAFDPLSVALRPAPGSLDEAQPAGRGILLMRRSADAASYERREGRNRLTLSFLLEARAGETRGAT